MLADSVASTALQERDNSAKPRRVPSTRVILCSSSKERRLSVVLWWLKAQQSLLGRTTGKREEGTKEKLIETFIFGGTFLFLPKFGRFFDFGFCELSFFLISGKYRDDPDYTIRTTLRIPNERFQGLLLS